MSTTAIITMVIIQGAITAITVRIFYLVMNPPQKNGDSEKSSGEK